MSDPGAWQACVSASDEVGLGHIVRMQALFQAADLHLQCLWVWTDWPLGRLSRITDGQSITPVPLDCCCWPGSVLPQSLAIDMPDPPLRLLEETRLVPRKLLLGCSDERQVWADLTVNVAEGGPLITAQPTACERLWEGARFAPLRPAFRRGRQHQYNSYGAVLIALGGTDAARLSLSVASIILASEELRRHMIEVVATPTHPDYRALRSLAKSSNRLRILQPKAAIDEWIQNAAAAVVAPGNLLFECLAMETPALAVAQNSRQLKDFATYPWIVSWNHTESLGNRLAKLMKCERESWLAYARTAAPGESLGQLIEWCRRPVIATTDF